MPTLGLHEVEIRHENYYCQFWPAKSFSIEQVFVFVLFFTEKIVFRAKCIQIQDSDHDLKRVSGKRKTRKERIVQIEEYMENQETNLSPGGFLEQPDPPKFVNKIFNLVS